MAGHSCRSALVWRSVLATATTMPLRSVVSSVIQNAYRARTLPLSARAAVSMSTSSFTRTSASLSARIISSRIRARTAARAAVTSASLARAFRPRAPHATSQLRGSTSSTTAASRNASRTSASRSATCALSVTLRVRSAKARLRHVLSVSRT